MADVANLEGALLQYAIKEDTGAARLEGALLQYAIKETTGAARLEGILLQMAVYDSEAPTPGGGGRESLRKGQAKGRGFSIAEINASLGAGYNSAFD